MATQQTPTVTAREMQWSYRGEFSTEDSQTFYKSLVDPVRAEITRRVLARTNRITVGQELGFMYQNYPIRARLTFLDPPNATIANASTRINVAFQERKERDDEVNSLITEIIRYPNERFGNIYQSLVGLDTIKTELFRKLTLFISPKYLENWQQHNYAQQTPTEIVQILQERYPLFLLEGEVGSGKTALARSIGHSLANSNNTEIILVVMNSQVRGSGLVGQMSRNIANVFREVQRIQTLENIPVMLLIDEADTISASRGGNQRHHEDDAGVNTLIQEIDKIRGRRIPIFFATNQIETLDSAILRRANSRYHFDRPDSAQRAQLFRTVLMHIHVSDDQIRRLATLTEPREIEGFGNDKHRFTYSDLTQRIIPYAVEECVYQGTPLTFDALQSACISVNPTPEFRSH